MAIVTTPRIVAVSDARTATCMNNAFFSGLILEPSEEKTINPPKSAGNKAVTYPVKIQNTDPSATSRYPIAAVICGMFKPKKVNRVIRLWQHLEYIIVRSSQYKKQIWNIHPRENSIFGKKKYNQGHWFNLCKDVPDKRRKHLF